MSTLEHIIHPWLNHQGSLTDKLKAIASDVHLEIIRHEWSASDSWDKQKLNIVSEDSLHREIIMWASSHACWYARTIIPKKTYAVEEALFKRLETEPLGELIWHKPHIKRQSIIPYSINKDTLEYRFLAQKLHQNADSLWARLSTISIHDTFSFYLLEIFLPDLNHYLKCVDHF